MNSRDVERNIRITNFFAIIMTFMKVVFFATLLYFFYEVIRNPTLIGEFVGKVVIGYKRITGK